MSNSADKPLKPLKSSLLQAYSYDVEAKLLNIVYRDGTEHTYKDINPDLMSKVFDSSGSIGSKFIKLISRQYKAQPTED